ncbi:MAG: hypothetical protein GY834_02245 [Bacteroidetes bacterium]|nr:hypothetical protein [Bacteroidota bacterium]
MKFKEINVRVARKVSDGNYGSAEYSLGVTVTVEEHDLPTSQIIKQLNKFCKDKVRDEMGI